MKEISKSRRSVISSILLSAMLTLGLVPMPAQATGCSLTGAGTSVDPYVVDSSSDFLDIPNCDGANVNFAQTSNLYLYEDAPNFEPFNFSGFYDGLSSRIEFVVDVAEATLDVDRSNAGLFRKLLPGSTVKDLDLAGRVVGLNNVGLLAGEAEDATIFGIGLSSSRPGNGVFAEGSFAGGLVGSSLNSTISNVTVNSLDISGRNFVGGIAGEFLVSDGSVTEISQVFSSAELTLLTDSQDPDSAFLGGLFGRLVQESNLQISESGWLSTGGSDVDTNPDRAVVAGGLIGLHESRTSSSGNTLSLNQTFAKAELYVESENQDLSLGLLVGRSESRDIDSIQVQDSYSVLNTFSSEFGSVEMPTDAIAGTQDGGSSPSISATSYFYSGLEGQEISGQIPGAALISELDSVGHTQFWVDQGWEILDARSNAGIQDGSLTPDWYIGHDNYSNGPSFYSPIPLWLSGELYELVEQEEPYVYAQPNWNPSGDSWIDVDVSDRVYLDPLNTSLDDRELVFVPAGAECTDGWNTTDPENYPGGYLVDADFSEVACTIDGRDVIIGSDSEYDGGFDIGFDFAIGNRIGSKAYLSTNGNLSFQPDVDDYDETLFEHAVDEEATVISALMVDQEFEPGVSAIWAAKTEIDGKKAAVFSWENMAIFPSDESRSRNENASYQVVLVQETVSDVELWFNYDQVAISPGEAAGISDNILQLDLSSGVRTGSNVVEVQPAGINGLSCTAFEFADSLVEAAISDPAMSNLYNSDNGQPLLFVTTSSQEEFTVELFTDSACEVPLVMTEVQNEEVDGLAILELIAEESASAYSLPIGYGSFPIQSGQFMEFKDYFLNIPMTDLVDGGVNELINLSIGTEVPGRIVSSFSITTPVTSGSAASYQGPVVTANKVVGLPGESIQLAGENLSSVEAVEIDGVRILVQSVSSTAISFIIPEGISAGVKDVNLISAFGKLTIASLITVGVSISNTATAPIASVKRIDDSVRIFATDIIGAGKVQFFFNGKEVAWVRAVDEADPKLRYANERYYLVRTIALVPGVKNVLEIWVDGVRLKRVAYTN